MPNLPVPLPSNVGCMVCLAMHKMLISERKLEASGAPTEEQVVSFIEVCCFAFQLSMSATTWCRCLHAQERTTPWTRNLMMQKSCPLVWYASVLTFATASKLICLLVAWSNRPVSQAWVPWPIQSSQPQTALQANLVVWSHPTSLFDFATQASSCTKGHLVLTYTCHLTCSDQGSN